MEKNHSVPHGITVNVKPSFDSEHSQPEYGRYFFRYLIRIENGGKKTAQVVSRHWVIVDGQGRLEEVRGPGVVGQQPILHPGESFEYESFCPLSTPTGTMQGTYQVILDDAEKVDVEIPQFYLVEPNSYH